MIEIPEEKLKEIADELNIGMLCFYHKETGEIVSYPKDLEFSGLEDAWEDLTEKVNSNPDDYFEFEGMSSREGFKVMENFVGQMTDISTKKEFIDVLSRKKPFANFNDLLHYYPDLREQWFKFKEAKYLEFVRDQAIRFQDFDDE